MNGDEQAAGPHAECYACPVGLVFASVNTAQPEALEHLLNAASEMAAAARSLIDAAERVIAEQRARTGAAGGRIRRVDLE